MKRKLIFDIYVFITTCIITTKLLGRYLCHGGLLVSDCILYTGADPGGGAHPAHAPLKLEKIWLFGVKSWFFIRNTPNIFPPPSARRNFFKCAPPPLTWNPGSALDIYSNPPSNQCFGTHMICFIYLLLKFIFPK